MLKRCKTLRALNLCFDFDIGDTSVTTIIENLKPSLEELDVTVHQITFEKILELKAMPNLKILNCRHLESHQIEVIRQNFPKVMINRR